MVTILSVLLLTGGLAPSLRGAAPRGGGGRLHARSAVPISNAPRNGCRCAAEPRGRSAAMGGTHTFLSIHTSVGACRPRDVEPVALSVTAVVSG